MLSVNRFNFLILASKSPFELGVASYLTTILIAHLQWLLKIDWGLEYLRTSVFLFSFASLVWAVSVLVSERRTTRAVFFGVMSVGFVLIAVLLDRFVLDLSSDTLTSHFELAKSTASGVNPYFDSEIEGSLDEYSVLGVSFHMLAAVGLDLGLSRNPFVLPYLHMILLAMGALSTLLRSYLSGPHLLFAVGFPLLAFPTLAQQVLTGYRDGYSGLAILSCVALLMHGWSLGSVRSNYLLLVFAFSACLPSIKLSLVPVALLLGATCLVHVTAVRGFGHWLRAQTLATAAVVVILWVFPTAFALMTSNETSRSLLSTEVITTTWSGSSSRLLQMNIFEEIGTLLFGVVQQNPPDIVWGLPFQTPSGEEVLVSGSSDSRLAGFGPLFGEALIFALLAGISTTIRSIRVSENNNELEINIGDSRPISRKLHWWLATIMVISFLATPFRFNARYVVHLYVLVLLLLGISLSVDHPKSRWSLVSRGFRLISVFFLLANSSVVWYGSIKTALNSRRLALELVDNYVDRVDNAPTDVKYTITTGGKWGIFRYLPASTPAGREVTVELSCNPETSARVYWLGDDIGICEYRPTGSES